MPTQVDAQQVKVTLSWRPEVTVTKGDGDPVVVDTGLDYMYGRVHFTGEVLADPDWTVRAVKHETAGMMHDLAAFVESDEWAGLFETVQGYRLQVELAILRAIATA